MYALLLTPSIGEFKFGGMVWYHHMYMHAVEILADFNLAVEIHAAQSPIFSAVWYILYKSYNCG